MLHVAYKPVAYKNKKVYSPSLSLKMPALLLITEMKDFVNKKESYFF